MDLIRNSNFNDLLEALPDPILIYNNHGNPIFVNPAFKLVYGFTPEELMNNLSKFEPVQEKQKTMDAWKRTLNGEKTIFETLRNNKEGDLLNTQINTTIIKGNNHVEILFILKNIMPIQPPEKEKDILIAKLNSTLSNLKTLSCFLPICSHCKKIRDENGFWDFIEHYLEKHTSIKFSHGICPDCTESLYGHEDWYHNLKKKQGHKQNSLF